MATRVAAFLDRSTVDQGDLDLKALESAFPHWNHHARTAPEETLDRVREAEVVVTNKVLLGREILAQAEQLKLICIAATGTNNVDLVAARERGIAVTNVKGYSTPSVVQHAFTMILTLVTRMDDYRAAVAKGRWQQAEDFCLLDYPIGELAGMRLGIVGYGTLGKAVAGVARAFGMEVLIAARTGTEPQEGRMALNRLLPQVDVLSLHCPLTEQTRGLIGAAELSQMKPGAILINVARGGVVDEQALANALRTGEIGGAGVDVLSSEPPREGNPLLDGEGCPNLIVTPHTAWAGQPSRQRLIEGIAANIVAFTRGERRNRVE